MNIWLFVLEAAVIVTGNVTVLVVFTRTPALRKRKHYLLVSLAVADLLVGVISVPMYVTMSFVGFRKTIYQTQDIIFGTASVFGLTAVAIERVYAVYFPFKYRALWKGVYMIGIAVIWVMATFIAFSSIFYELSTFKIFVNCAPIIFCLAVVIISYFLIWIRMNCMTSVQGHAIHEHDKRLTVTVLVVTVISLIAWIPFQALTLYAILCGNKCFYGKGFYILIGIAKFLQYGNSLVNPIIYALRMPQFKRVVFNAVRCCKQDQLAVQVLNERSQRNRANVISLTTKHDNNAFTADDCQGHTVRDETQLKDNTNNIQLCGRHGIQINEDNQNDTSPDINVNGAQVSGRDGIQINVDNEEETGADINVNGYKVSGRDGIQINVDNEEDTSTDINVNDAQVSGIHGIQIHEGNDEVTSTDINVNGAQVSGGHGIKISVDNEEDTSTDINVNGAQFSGRDGIQISVDNGEVTSTDINVKLRQVSGRDGM